MAYRNNAAAGCALSAIVLGAVPTPASGGDFTDKFKDPEDGKFDISGWLGEAAGFLPVPIIITEPAVGYGGGLAAVFFHGKLVGRMTEDGRLIPPSVSGVAAAATENGTKFGALFHMGIWKDDHVRYTGAIGAADVNLTFYGLGGGGGPIGDNGVRFSIDSGFLFNKVLFRLGDSDFFVGPTQNYMDATTRFSLGADLPVEIPDPKIDVTTSGLGVEMVYDGLDNIFSPNRGLKGLVEATWYDPDWGSDDSFAEYRGSVNYYLPLGSSWVLGLRADLSTITGDPPFYKYPFVDLRGIPAMRYQGDDVWVGEVEGRWDFTPRWSAVFFGGAGEASPVRNDEEGEGVVWTRGLGFRYLMARAFGLRAGIDVASGPEETVFYIQVGGAWSR